MAAARFDFKALKFNFDHVATQFPDENGKFVTGRRKSNHRYVSSGMYLHSMKYKYVGQCFSSTTRGKWTGVRFAPANEVLKHPERWKGIEAEVSEEEYNDMLTAAEGEVGKKYDYSGLFTGFFMLAWYLQNDKERFCSDIIAWLAWIGKMLKKRIWIISPRTFARKLAEKYGEPIQL